MGTRNGLPPARFRAATFIGGGGKRDRTADLLHAMQALSQLSYTPNGEAASIAWKNSRVNGRP
jgi:hypothetical protein